MDIANNETKALINEYRYILADMQVEAAGTKKAGMKLAELTRLHHEIATRSRQMGVLKQAPKQGRKSAVSAFPRKS